jgi:hypothetical protein
MNSFFARAREGLNRGLNALRPQPFVTSPEAEIAAAPPALPVERFDATWIEASDFRPTNKAARPSEWVAAGIFKMPEALQYRIPSGTVLRFYIKAVVRVAGLNGGAPSSQTQALLGLVDTPLGNPVLPTSNHNEVVIWQKVAGIWSKATITAINYTTGVVTYTQAAGATDVEFYYLHNRGEWRISLERLLGSDRQTSQILNNSFGAMHTVNQNDIDSSYKVPQDVDAVSGQQLIFEAYSDLEISFNERAGNIMQMVAQKRQIAVFDKRTTSRLFEVAGRKGV